MKDSSDTIGDHDDGCASLSDNPSLVVRNTATTETTTTTTKHEQQEVKEEATATPSAEETETSPTAEQDKTETSPTATSAQTMNPNLFDAQRKIEASLYGAAAATAAAAGSSTSGAATGAAAADDPRMALFHSLAGDSQAPSLLINTNPSSGSGGSFAAAAAAAAAASNPDFAAAAAAAAQQQQQKSLYLEAMMLQQQQQQQLVAATKAAAAVASAGAATSSAEDGVSETKRKLLMVQASTAAAAAVANEPTFKKRRSTKTDLQTLPTSTSSSLLEAPAVPASTISSSPDLDPLDPVVASEEGISSYNDSDVLSGRGGGTNVHPGNRHFRDLINLHRRAYLKARKNDKPAISRAIVRAVRENNGRFLKREDKTGLWFEIGDDAAREKTSQALRQRAPEMRKILFETERQQAEEQFRQQQQQQHQILLGSSGLGGLGSGFASNSTQLQAGLPGAAAAAAATAAADLMGAGGLMNPMSTPSQSTTAGVNMNMLLAMQQLNKQASNQQGAPDAYSQVSQNLMALLGGGNHRFNANSG